MVLSMGECLLVIEVLENVAAYSGGLNWYEHLILEKIQPNRDCYLTVDELKTLRNAMMLIHSLDGLSQEEVNLLHKIDTEVLK